VFSGVYDLTVADLTFGGDLEFPFLI